MQSQSCTVVVLALVLALTGVREANGAPIINWDLCTKISLELNEAAQHLAKEVLGGSRWLDNIGEQVVLVEPTDMCDPAGLKTDSKIVTQPFGSVSKANWRRHEAKMATDALLNFKPCLQKLITALGNYSKIFQTEDLFVGSEREMAQKVVVTVTELLGQLGAKEPQGPATKHQAWMQQGLARYSAQRLLSFSVIVARVFAAGNPAAHGNAPPTSCHQS